MNHCPALPIFTAASPAQQVGVVVASVASAILLAGCSGSVSVEPAPEASSVACAQVIAALHGTGELAGLQRREVTAQSAAAWGEPAVTLRCGVTPPGPTTEGCLGVNGVDWVGPRDPQDNDRRYTTYGRSPAVEVFVPVGSEAAIETVLTELGGVVQGIPQDRTCS